MADASLKHRLRALVKEGRLGEIAQLAGRSTRVLDLLVPLTFDGDQRVAWRAVEAMGAASEEIAERDPDRVREHLRRLFWLLSEESGGICWRAPEAMAEIVSRRPDLFADYIPVVSHLILETAEEDLSHFRAGMLWAIGRLGPLAAADASDVLPAVSTALGHEEAQVRGMAVWCLGRLGHTDVLARHAQLGHDEGEVEVYEDGEVTVRTVRDLRDRVLADEGRGSPARSG